MYSFPGIFHGDVFLQVIGVFLQSFLRTLNGVASDKALFEKNELGGHPCLRKYYVEKMQYVGTRRDSWVRASLITVPGGLVLGAADSSPHPPRKTAAGHQHTGGLAPPEHTANQGHQPPNSTGGGPAPQPSPHAAPELAATDEDLLSTDDEYLSEENLRWLLERWELTLWTGIGPCLESEDWMERRNALNILSKATPLFPFTRAVGDRVLKKVRHIANTDGRKDLQLFAKSLDMKISATKKVWRDREGTFFVAEICHHPAISCPHSISCVSSHAYLVRISCLHSVLV